MSTFFDKLSGTQAAKNEIDLTAMRTARPVRHAESAVEKEEEQYPVRTADVDPEKPEEEEKEEKEEKIADEEEGELTVDIYNKGESIVIQSTVAGVKPEHLDVAITDDMVTIRGRRERGDQVKEDSYYYKELFWGTFSRQVILPEEIEQEEAEAHLQHGLLTIKLPKKRHGVTQKLKVKVV
ncbi:MAG: Hsp20/alpha crystallin family protein, partial [Candidatus Sungbacteria bacterium]|nr:Hsp20/alpha crystallin family protein [bacterium]MDZ4260069.1 Hsp20/alpha crystallin family protein [Candidatus Sungbacteria bacterium]